MSNTNGRARREMIVRLARWAQLHEPEIYDEFVALAHSLASIPGTFPEYRSLRQALIDARHERPADPPRAATDAENATVPDLSEIEKRLSSSLRYT